jgi:hypothetical protein
MERERELSCFSSLFLILTPEKKKHTNMWGRNSAVNNIEYKNKGKEATLRRGEEEEEKGEGRGD